MMTLLFLLINRFSLKSGIWLLNLLELFLTTKLIQIDQISRLNCLDLISWLTKISQYIWLKQILIPVWKQTAQFWVELFRYCSTTLLVWHSILYCHLQISTSNEHTKLFMKTNTHSFLTRVSRGKLWKIWVWQGPNLSKMQVEKIK